MSKIFSAFCILADEKSTTANIGLAIWQLKCFYGTFVQGSTTVILLNFCAEIRHIAKRGDLICNPLRQSAIMNRLSIPALLLILASCGQNTSKNKSETINDTISSNVEEHKLSTSPIEEPGKHGTFNESMDTISETFKTFIPPNYAVIDLSTGDANLDGLTDKILILGKNTEETTSNYADNKPDKRPLLLLLGQSDNSYKLAYRNDNAVYCIDCGGVFGDPFTGTTIKNGYFSIEHGISGGQHWEQVITFKYDKLKNQWFLYKDHYVSYKLNESNDPNAEALVPDVDKMETSKDFGVIPFEKFNIYTEDGNQGNQ